VPEVEAIRDKHHSLTTMPLNGYVDVEARGQSLDINADVALDERGTFTLSVLCSDDDSQRTDIHYSAAEAALVIEREHASTADTDERHPHRATHPLANGEHLSLRVLLDGSVLEVIANERTSITSRVYPTSFSQDGLRVHGQNATLHTLAIYEMPSIWE
jgi:beta-fructofuranosidase